MKHILSVALVLLVDVAHANVVCTAKSQLGNNVEVSVSVFDSQGFCPRRRRPSRSAMLREKWFLSRSLIP